MIKEKQYYFLTPTLLALFLFSSNFLSTDLFQSGVYNFSVWFILSLFSFACGWFIDTTFGWHYGGKIIFAVVVATSIIGVMLVLMFTEYFGVNDLITENLLLYSTRNIILGSMSFFGMAVKEVLRLQKRLSMYDKNEEIHSVELKNLKKEATLALKEAKIKADGIVLDAEKKSADVLNKKQNFESQIKQLIQIERELIKKYESNE